MTEAHAELNSTTELRIRVASAAILIAAVILAVLGGPLIFAALIAICAVVALREWHRLVNAGRTPWEAIPASVTILAVIWLALSGAPLIYSGAAIAAGAAATAALAASRRSWVFWHAFGVVYIGIPVLALIALRESPLNGGFVVGGVFAAVWAADSGALFVGRLLGGPRLAPLLSPKKTWAGLIGGILLAGAAEAIYVSLVGGSVLQGVLFGLSLGVVANCGDLFESWVKRVFRTKNSGNLIPGHGGMLDRVDSLLFAAPAAAAFLFLSGDNSLFGANL